MKFKVALLLGLAFGWGCSGSDGNQGPLTTGGSTGLGGSGTGSASGSTSGAGAPGSSETTLTIEESGLCSYDGVEESEHSGFAGTGYVNTTNALGSSLRWSLSSAGGEATLSFRYAALDARPAKLLVDGKEVGTLDFPATSDWTSWGDAPLSVTLPEGLASVVLQASSAAGLPNIDSLTATGPNLDSAPCPESTSPPNVFATATGTVEVWVNGKSLGSTTSAGSLLKAAGTFVAGTENIIAVRATKGAAPAPSFLAELDGTFGRAGSSNLWRAKAAATANELSGSDWTQHAFDDSAWTFAKDVAVEPTAAELVDGPARGIWSGASTDSTALFRLRLYFPTNWSANSPRGFGKNTTGGEGGEVVTVTTPAQLVAAVSGSNPRVVRITGTIDFRGTEGAKAESACYVAQCASGPSEYILGGLGACDGKSTFNVDVDQAGANPLLIGSNKTLLGVGPHAAILGKGLKFTTATSSNIIIRNLTISEINAQIVWGGDGLSIFGAHDIWFDHNRISRVGRQFICAAYDPNTNITFSFNEFDGRTPYSATCNGATYWVAFLMGADDTITSYGNWYHHTSGRNPDIASTAMHSVNDYFETVPGHLAEMWETATLLYEGTYFEDVDTVFGANASGHLFAPLASTVSSVNASCVASLGRNCVANATNRSANEATFGLDTEVLTTFSEHTDYLVTPFPAAEVPHCVPHLAGPGHI